MARILSIWFCALMTVALAIGCSSRDSSQSKINLQLPSQFPKTAGPGAQGVGAFYTAADIGHIVINVSGADIRTPIFFSWDRKQAGSNATPPTSISLTVPRGTERLVQVLFVFEPANSEVMDLHYGDAVKTLSSENESVAVKVVPVATSLGKEGTIAGRWLNADGVSGPTGKVQARFVPPNGRPPMIIMTTEILNGWFNFFVLDQVRFNYVMHDGTVLFNGVHLDSESLVSADVADTAFNEAHRRLRVKVPQYYFTRGSGDSTREPSEERTYTLGYFGPGAGERRICYDGTATNVNIPYSFVAATGDTTIKWVGLNPNLGANPPQAGIVPVSIGGVSTIGGTTIGSTGCPAAETSAHQEFLNYLTLNHSQITSQDSVLGFRGPYRNFAGTDPNYKNFYNLQMTGAGLSVEWQYLPQMAETVLDGTALFYRVGADQNEDEVYADGDGIRCSDLQNPDRMPGGVFTLGATVASSQTSTTITGIDATDFNDGNVMLVACPYKDAAEGRRYLNSGMMMRHYGGWGGGGGFGMTNISFATTTLNPVDCVAVTVSTSMGGVPDVQSSNLPLSVNADQGDFYPTAACATGGEVTGSMVIASGQSQATYYYKNPSVGFRNVSVSAAGYNSGSQQVAVVSGNTPTQISIQGDSKMATGYCYRIPVHLLDSAGSPTIFGSNLTLNFSAPFAGTWHTDDACTSGPVPTGTIPLNSHEAVYYFTPTATTGSGELSITVGTPVNSSHGFPTEVGPSTITSYGVKEAYQRSSSTFTAVGQCQSVRVIAFNSIGAEVKAASAQSVSLAISGGTFHSDGMCSMGSSSTASTSIPSGSSMSDYVYFKSTSSANVLITPTVGGTAYPAEVFEYRPMALAIRGPFDGSATAEPETQLMTDFCHPFTVELFDSNNQLWTNSSGSTLPIAILLNNSMAGLYSDPMCTSSLSTLDIPVGFPRSPTFWVKVSSPSGYTLMASVNAADDNSVGNSFSLSTTMVTPASVVIPDSGSCSVGSNTHCMQVYLSASGNVTRDVEAQLTTGAYGEVFYADSSCSSTLSTATSLTIPLGSSASPAIWVKAVASSNFAVNATGGFASWSQGGGFCSP